MIDCCRSHLCVIYSDSFRAVVSVSLQKFPTIFEVDLKENSDPVWQFFFPNKYIIYACNTY